MGVAGDMVIGCTEWRTTQVMPALEVSVQMEKVTCTSGSARILSDTNGVVWIARMVESVQLLASGRAHATASPTLEHTLSARMTVTVLGQACAMMPVAGIGVAMGRGTVVAAIFPIRRRSRKDRPNENDDTRKA